MAYNATYTSDDTSPIVIDTGNKALVQVASFSAILGLFLTLGIGAFLVRWVRKQ